MGFTSVKEVCIQSPLKVGYGRYSVGFSSGLVDQGWVCWVLSSEW